MAVLLTWISKPFWEAFFLEHSVEVDAGVGEGGGHDLDFELEVAEGGFYGAVVEEVGAGAVGGECAIDQSPGAEVFAGFPAVERAPVEERDPIAGGGFERERGGGGQEPQRSGGGRYRTGAYSNPDASI